MSLWSHRNLKSIHLSATEFLCGLGQITYSPCPYLQLLNARLSSCSAFFFNENKERQKKDGSLEQVQKKGR